jgi:hypothetical protein
MMASSRRIASARKRPAFPWTSAGLWTLTKIASLLVARLRRRTMGMSLMLPWKYGIGTVSALTKAHRARRQVMEFSVSPGGE